jgi:1-acyl-sn-glycerol-3-phosphate acyltransferase
VLAPEGTFNETSQPLISFYDGAFRIAIETKTPIKPLLFLDAYDRLHYSSFFTLSPGKSRIVYLEEIAVEGYSLNDIALLKEKVYQVMEAGLLKYKATWIQ